MTSTLTCFFSLYDKAIPELPELGGNSKNCIRVDAAGDDYTSLFVRIPPLHPMHTLHSSAVATTMVAGKAQILAQRSVYVKWAFDMQRIDALRYETGFYMNELAPLQGTVVPRMIGYYESTDKHECFALLILEHCSGCIPADYAEYHRQYMVAACALHARGVTHGQLARGYAHRGAHRIDPHVLADRTGRVRIVDFTRAVRHVCAGAPPNVPGVVSTARERDSCEELTRLEALVGERRTGMTAQAACTRRRAQQQQQQYVRPNGGRPLAYLHVL